SSRSTSSQTSPRRRYISQVIALRASGRLNVSVTIAPSRSTTTCSVEGDVGSIGASGAGEAGLSLLHERRLPFAVVVAREARRDRAIARGDVALGGVPQRLGDDELGGAHGERRVAGDRPRHLF